MSNLYRTDIKFICDAPLRNNKVRLFHDGLGENVHLVLEDIMAILLGVPPHHEEAIARVEEKIQEANVTPIIQEELHLVDADNLEIFCSQSDDLGVDGSYEALQEFWDKLSSNIKKKIAHHGDLTIEVSTWEKYQPKIRRVFEETYNDEITLRRWVEKLFNLEMSWSLTALTTEVRSFAGYINRINSDRNPDKQGGEKGNNLYTPHNLIPAISKVKKYLKKPKEIIAKAKKDGNLARVGKDGGIVQPGVSFSQDVDRVKSLKRTGRSTESIIKEIWGVTPFSHLVEWDDGETCNYQYDILAAFMNWVEVPRQ